MEVHHHPQVEKKSLKEYLLEGLMIFLAVTLGFFAENIREHFVERKKEKEYVKTMIEDLKKDSAYLNLCINHLIPEHVKYFDSTVYFLQLPDQKANNKELYHAFLNATEWNFNYYATQRTLSQLKSAGFYYIKNTLVGDQLSELEINYNAYGTVNSFVNELQNDIDQSSYVFANQDVIKAIHEKSIADNSNTLVNVGDITIPITINTSNKEGILAFINKIRKYSYYINITLKKNYAFMLKFISKTITILKNEYQFE